MVKQAERKIMFHYQTPSFYFPERSRLKSFLLYLFREEKYKVGQVSYIFCSDDYLLKLNRQFLAHDTLTDIITFPLAQDPIVAEIYISVDRVRDNAELYKTTFRSELTRVMFHGALHLCGYKDKTKSQASLMREKESIYLQSYL